MYHAKEKLFNRTKQHYGKAYRVFILDFIDYYIARVPPKFVAF